MILWYFFPSEPGCKPRLTCLRSVSVLRMGLVVAAASLSYLHPLGQQTEKGDHVRNPSDNQHIQTSSLLATLVVHQ